MKTLNEIKTILARAVLDPSPRPPVDFTVHYPDASSRRVRARSYIDPDAPTPTIAGYAFRGPPTLPTLWTASTRH